MHAAIPNSLRIENCAHTPGGVQKLVDLLHINALQILHCLKGLQRPESDVWLMTGIALLHIMPHNYRVLLQNCKYANYVLEVSHAP